MLAQCLLLNTPEGSPLKPQHPILLTVSSQATRLQCFPHLPVKSRGFSSYTYCLASPSRSDPGQAETLLSSPLCALLPDLDSCLALPALLQLPSLSAVNTSCRKLKPKAETPSSFCHQIYKAPHESLSLQLHKVRKSPCSKPRRVLHSTPEPVHVS